jgi:hypothetical protein
MSHILNNLCTLRRDVIDPNEKQLSSRDGIVKINRRSLDSGVSATCVGKHVADAPAKSSPCPLLKNTMQYLAMDYISTIQQSPSSPLVKNTTQNLEMH